MRAAVERMQVPGVAGRGSLRVTASFGLAVSADGAATPDALVGAADAALYRAKRGGKNRVEQALSAEEAGDMAHAEPSTPPR